MTLPRTVTGWLLLGLLGGALAQGCGASSKTHNPASSGPTAGSAGKDTGSMTVEPPGVSGAGGESPYDPLCGIPSASSCVPDEANNAMCVASPSGGAGRTSTSSGGSSTGTGGTAGQRTSTGGTNSPGANGGTGTSESGPSGAGGEGGVKGSAGASEGGVGTTAGGAPAANGGEAGARNGEAGAGQPGLGGAGMSAEAGTGPGTGALGGRQGSTGGASAGHSSSGTSSSGVSCQVTENPKHKGSPLAVCGPAGTGTEGSPCFSGADCAPSLACVGDGPGQCRAYCCSGASECNLDPGTHCTVEPLVLATKSARTLEVPVCMPPVKCSLAEPYPCPDGVTCSCPADSACVVVSDDGTTSCVPVSQLPAGDQGTEGMACPCAWGYVCSQATNACVKLCEVAAADPTCSSDRCQASAALPAGWGTCVGTAPKDAGAP